MEVLIVYYSMYGHIYRMAEAVKEGAGSVSGTDVRICRVPETLPDDILEKMGALKTQKSLAHVPVCKVNDLAAADAIIFGTPTRFGNMCGLCLCRPDAHRRDHRGIPLRGVHDLGRRRHAAAERKRACCGTLPG